MERITNELKNIRNRLILQLFNDQVSAEKIGLIFDLTTSQVYNIIKEQKELQVAN